MYPHLPRRLTWLRQRPFPLIEFCCLAGHQYNRPPPTSHPASSWISLLRLIPFVTLAVGHRPDEISPVPSPTFTTSRSPYTGGSFAAALPGSSPLPWPSLLAHKLGSLFLPFGLTFRRGKIHFMLRAVASLSLLRRLQRFGTPGHPGAPVACYLAA